MKPLTRVVQIQLNYFLPALIKLQQKNNYQSFIWIIIHEYSNYELIIDNKFCAIENKDTTDIKFHSTYTNTRLKNKSKQYNGMEEETVPICKDKLVCSSSSYLCFDQFWPFQSSTPLFFSWWFCNATEQPAHGYLKTQGE